MEISLLHLQHESILSHGYKLLGTSQANLKNRIERPVKANQVNDVIIDMVIFDADTCLMDMHMSYIWYAWIVYESIWYDMICICYNMWMVW